MTGAAITSPARARATTTPSIGPSRHRAATHRAARPLHSSNETKEAITAPFLGQDIEVKGRFAPSPTGRLHLGNLRTALVAWLFARSTGSQFVVRMDDLDPVTSRREHGAAQLADMAALGLDWDEDVVWQSERAHLYSAAFDRLAAAGLVYPCYCTRREILSAAQAPNGPSTDTTYPGTCRTLTDRDRERREAEGRRPAWRLRSSGESVAFTDVIAGRYEMVVDDVVLRRNDGVHAYNLAVVVDDAEQRLEQVVRADDLLSSTPRQIHLARLLELPPMSYAHVPLVLGPTGARLAKRDGGQDLPAGAQYGKDA